MKIYNPFRFLSKFEWGLWIGSLCVITVASLIGGEGDGVLSIQKGREWFHVLCPFFSVFF